MGMVRVDSVDIYISNDDMEVVKVYYFGDHTVLYNILEPPQINAKLVICEDSIDLNILISMNVKDFCENYKFINTMERD